MIEKQNITLNLHELKPNTNLLTTHTKKNIENMVRSIKMFGQLSPIIIDEDNVIIKGHSIYRAMQIINANSIVECIKVKANKDVIDVLRLSLTSIKYLSISKYKNKDSLLRSLIRKGIDDIPCYNKEAIERLKSVAKELEYEI